MGKATRNCIKKPQYSDTGAWELVIHEQPVAVAGQPMRLIQDIEVAYELGDIPAHMRDFLVREANRLQAEKEGRLPKSAPKPPNPDNLSDGNGLVPLDQREVTGVVGAVVIVGLIVLTLGWYGFG